MTRTRKPINENRHKVRRASLVETFAQREYLKATPRRFGAGPTSPPAKIHDPVNRALIDAALAQRGKAGGA